MKNYENIIFDLGGVIINLDYNKTAQAFIDLGLTNFNEIYSKAKQTSLFDDFEKGKMSNQEFRNTLAAHLPSSITDGQIDAAWNAMLLDIPSYRIEFLQNVAQRYRIFLLSNTNHIHVGEFTRLNDQILGKGVFESIFEKYYYSCEMGMRKPDEEIFEFVLSANNLDRTKTLFIDDSPQHVEGTRRTGLDAELLKVELEEKLEERFAFLLK
jgi:putative hydrolase of the HAD superfamily